MAEDDPFAEGAGEPTQGDAFSEGEGPAAPADPFSEQNPPRTVGDAFSEGSESASPSYAPIDPFVNESPQSPSAESLGEMPQEPAAQSLEPSLGRFDNETLSVPDDVPENPPIRHEEDQTLSSTPGDRWSSAPRAPADGDHAGDHGFTFSLHVHIPPRAGGGGEAGQGGWTFDMEAHTSCSVQAPGGEREHFHFGPADPSAASGGDGPVPGRISSDPADSSGITQEFSISRGQYESVHEYCRAQTKDGQLYGETTLQYTRASSGAPGEADSTSFTFRAAEHAGIAEARRYEAQSPQDVARTIEMERRLDEVERGFAHEGPERGANRRGQPSEQAQASPSLQQSTESFDAERPVADVSPPISEPALEAEHTERRAPRRARF